MTNQNKSGRNIAHEKTKLLELLLYKGVLPRYAFPTDVVNFYVFDKVNFTRYRHEFLYQPSQGLALALSQYAPGKKVWIDNKEFTSGAIYSPYGNEMKDMWRKRKLYYECSLCHHAMIKNLTEGTRHETLDCLACGSLNSFGPARIWVRPPGFAHPVLWDEEVSPDEQVPPSYATHAKLLAPTPPDNSSWQKINERVKVHHLKKHLLVTNKGSRDEGYNYCIKCGSIEPTAIAQSMVLGSHAKPYPDEREPNCPSNMHTSGIVLGTDFPTDILLISIRIVHPMTLKPGYRSTEVALRTLCESLTTAACTVLELEPRELLAEYRPALTPLGRQGLEVEIFLFDTLPGGAGFAKQVGNMAQDVFEAALDLLERV